MINFELDNNLGAYVARPKVDGADKGISSTFRISEDVFSTSDNRKLINNKQYYFVAVAYAYNEYLPYIPDVSPSQNVGGNYLGQKKPYLEGRRVKRAAGIPHNVDNEKGGTQSQSAYGFGPKIKRIEGQGNGGNMLTLTKASEDEIVANSFKAEITYENAQGPLSIKVVDPLNVKSSEFSFKFINHRASATKPLEGQNAMIPATTSTAVMTYSGTIATVNVDKTSWELKDLAADGKTYYPNEIKGIQANDTIYQTIRVGSEYYFPELGFSISVKQPRIQVSQLTGSPIMLF